MASMNTMQHSEDFKTNIKKAVTQAIGTQNKIEVISTVDGLDTKDNRRRLEKTISDYVRNTANHLAKLKTHINSLLAINKLPIELFTYIILLTNPSKMYEGNHPFISYTWVCHHWRFVLINNPDFWTTIQLKPLEQGSPITPLVSELLRRSKSSKLDVKLFVDSNLHIPVLQGFVAKESSRIQRLWLSYTCSRMVQLVFATNPFPSLKGVFFHCQDDFVSHYGIPTLAASEQMETLAFNCWWGNSNDLDMFSRLRKLSLGFGRHYTHAMLHSLLNSLQNSTELHTLKLRTNFFPPPSFSTQFTLPKLQFLSITDISLLEAIQAPKLSSLDARCSSPVTLAMPILKGFDFSRIKYFHVLDRIDGAYSILGQTKPIHPKSVFSITRSKHLFDELLFAEEVDHMIEIEDTFSDASPHDYFRLKFVQKDKFWETVDPPDGILLSILPQLTGLSELCIASRSLIDADEFRFDTILTHVPCVEKLIIPYGTRLMDFIHVLSNHSICPRLKYLSYSTRFFSPLSLDELEILAEDAGKLLTECLHSRHEANCSLLESIVLGNCPPLPDSWLKKLLKLGTAVMTEKDVAVRIFLFSNASSTNPPQCIRMCKQPVESSESADEIEGGDEDGVDHV